MINTITPGIDLLLPYRKRILSGNGRKCHVLILKSRTSWGRVPLVL